VTSRIAVLASGGGTNLQALLDHLDRRGEQRSGQVVVVASDRPDAGALERAHDRGVPTAVIATPGTDGAPIDELLERHSVDLVALAGYLRLVPPDVVARYRGRILNIHPALLPAFGGAGMYGARVHRAVLASGATLSGATVHFVDDEYDRGPIVGQWPVPVLPSDTPATLAARVLRVEHALYPLAVEAVASLRVRLAADGSVTREGAFPAADDGWTFRLDRSIGPGLASEIARAFGQD
jgi:formyltetrahydrofolate-dependent phosphoribosylglycinamide formyltransferase